MPEFSDVIAAALILAAAAMVQGFLGFGFGIVAMTGLTLSRDLLHAAGLVNVSGILVTSSVLLALRRDILWRPALRMLPWILVGVVGGVSALHSLDRELMVRTLGVTVIGISAWNLRSPSLRSGEAPLWDGVAGLIGGLLAGAFNTGGPPIVAHLYRRPDSPQAIKATIQLVFLSMGLIRLPTATAQGLMSEAIWTETALAAPFVLGGLLSGVWLGRRVSPTQFRKASWIALGALGAALVLSP